MTSAQLVFYLTCLFLGKMALTTDVKFFPSIRQDSGFILLKTGEHLILRCFYEGDFAARFYWYKQTVGKKPRLISTYYKFDKNGTFYNEFKKNPRFTLDTDVGKNHLKIRDLQMSDSATYFCASSYSYKFDFAEGTTVSVKGSGLHLQALVHQTTSETIQPGDSVTLNCTVHTGSCDGEHSVYWFKDSEESHPGFIYTHGDRNDQCERKPDTQTNTCIYNLPVKNLTISHAGTYYCAVASCGHVLFGNGTKVNIEDEVDSNSLIYFLSGALAFTIILSVLLTFSLCMIKKRSTCLCAESHSRISAHSTADGESLQNEENIHYAALKKHKTNRSRRQTSNTDTECVYSHIKQ
uniref:Ig-like domain-containing protein n=1 Tax=Anabas testudineus TaxID=64144 RepID=A0A3Q1K5H7_ANATE